MSTHIYLPSGCIKHNPHESHPEHPSRITAIHNRLNEVPIDNSRLIDQSFSIAIENIGKAHDSAYLERLNAAAPSQGIYHLDGDTAMDNTTLDTALLATGTVVEALRAVNSKQANNAFCAVRPPGHHAEHQGGMGFCFINSIAVAAFTALDQYGYERVAILDFDVHHGNGTQDIFENDHRVLFCSSYQHPLYPHQNSPNIEGRRVNVPLPGGTASESFRRSIDTTWWPALKRFRPDLILVSAGFDAHKLDPLAGLNLETEDYAWLGRTICEVAQTLCNGHVIAALEGGYHLDALADSTHAFINAMAGH